MTEPLSSRDDEPESMERARIQWLRDLGKAGLQYPGQLGLDAFAAGWDEGLAASAHAPLSERPFMEALGSVLRAQGFNDHDVATIRVDLIAELARPAERKDSQGEKNV